MTTDTGAADTGAADTSAADTGTAGRPGESIFGPNHRLTTIGAVIVVTLIAFDAMSVAAALPTAARELDGLANYGWSFTGFLIAMNFALVLSGILCDRQGPRLSLIAGQALFLVGLVGAGASMSMWQLIGARVVQGFGCGLMLTALYVLIGERYNDLLRPKIMALISSAWVVPSLVGPPLFGAVTQHISWRAVFLGLSPLVCVAALLMVPALRTMSSAPRSSGGRDDSRRLVQAGAVALGLCALVQAGQHPQPLWLVSAPVGGVLLVWGLSGLLPRGTIRLRRGVPTTVALRGLFAGAMFGAESLVPLALTVQHGYGATEAGLPLLIAALTWAVGSWWQGRDSAARHRPALVQLGFVLVTAACLVAALASTPAGPGWLMYLAWAIAGLGAGLTITSIGVLLLQWTTDDDRGRDSAAIQLSDGVVSALTTGLGGLLIAAAAHSYVDYTTAFVGLDLAMAGVGLVGVFAALRLRGGPS